MSLIFQKVVFVNSVLNDVGIIRQILLKARKISQKSRFWKDATSVFILSNIIIFVLRGRATPYAIEWHFNLVLVLHVVVKMIF